MTTRRTPRKPPPEHVAAPAPRTGGIARLVIENVRCFERAEVPLGAQVTVIIGQNGSGKTTIAEAIASLASDPREGLRELPLRRGATTGSIALFGDGGSAPMASWTRSVAGTANARLASWHHVFVYGQYRGLRPPARTRWEPQNLKLAGLDEVTNSKRPLPEDLADALRRPATRTLFDFDEYLFRDLAAYVALLAEQARESASARSVWEGLQRWLENVDGARIERVEIVELEGRPVAAFRRAGVALSIEELSDGYRAILTIVLDLVIRYSQLFGSLEDPLAGNALVVIDEIDLNLHPRWQRRVIEQLTSLFAGTHFVLTTHSPAVVQAAIDENENDGRIKVLVLDEDESGGRATTVRALTRADLKRLDGAEVDSVMVDEAVFGVGSRYSPKYERFEVEAAELRGKLEKGLATEHERKRLLGILDELHGLLAREDEREARGPLLSEIARTQIGLLGRLEGALSAKEQGGKPRDPAPAKRR